MPESNERKLAKLRAKLIECERDLDNARMYAGQYEGALSDARTDYYVTRAKSDQERVSNLEDKLETVQEDICMYEDVRTGLLEKIETVQLAIDQAIEKQRVEFDTNFKVWLTRERAVLVNDLAPLLGDLMAVCRLLLDMDAKGSPLDLMGVLNYAVKRNEMHPIDVLAVMGIDNVKARYAETDEAIEVQDDLD